MLVRAQDSFVVGFSLVDCLACKLVASWPLSRPVYLRQALKFPEVLKEWEFSDVN